MPRAARFSRQLGNSRENRFGALLESAGYAVAYTRGSRGGADIWAIHREGFRPHLLVAISRPTYTSVRKPFEKLRKEAPIAGCRLLLSRETVKDSWRVYLDEDTFLDIAGDITPVLEALAA